MEGTPVMDESIYTELNEIIQEEAVEEQNLAMMGLLNKIGIQKGQPPIKPMPGRYSPCQSRLNDI